MHLHLNCFNEQCNIPHVRTCEKLHGYKIFAKTIYLAILFHTIFFLLNGQLKHCLSTIVNLDLFPLNLFSRKITAVYTKLNNIHFILYVLVL